MSFFFYLGAGVVVVVVVDSVLVIYTFEWLKRGLAGVRLLGW